MRFACVSFFFFFFDPTATLKPDCVAVWESNQPNSNTDWCIEGQAANNGWLWSRYSNRNNFELVWSPETSNCSGNKIHGACCGFPLIDLPISRMNLYRSDQLAWCCAQCTTWCSGTSLPHCLRITASLETVLAHQQRGHVGGRKPFYPAFGPSHSQPLCTTCKAGKQEEDWMPLFPWHWIQALCCQQRVTLSGWLFTKKLKWITFMLSVHIKNRRWDKHQRRNKLKKKTFPPQHTQLFGSNFFPHTILRRHPNRSPSLNINESWQ